MVIASLKFNSNNDKATNVESTITSLSGEYHNKVIPQQSSVDSNSTIYSNLIKNLKFYADDTINRSELGTVLNNTRIPSIYDVWPNISHTSSISNSVSHLLLGCDDVSFINNDNNVVRSGDFTINFANRNETYAVNTSQTFGHNITNYAFFIYNVKNEIISINGPEPGPDVRKAFYTSDTYAYKLFSHKFVNLISDPSDNVNLIIIDGTSIETIYNDLPKITIQDNTSNNTSILLRNCNGVSLDYSVDTFNDSFSLVGYRDGLPSAYKIHTDDITSNNLFIYVYNLHNANIVLQPYNNTYQSPAVSNVGILNGFINILNYNDYSIIVIDGMYVVTANQSKIEDIFNKITYDLSGNNNTHASVVECSGCFINVV
jgi:hypothetical protein